MQRTVNLFLEGRAGYYLSFTPTLEKDHQARFFDVVVTAGDDGRPADDSICLLYDQDREALVKGVEYDDGWVGPGSHFDALVRSGLDELGVKSVDEHGQRHFKEGGGGGGGGARG